LPVLKFTGGDIRFGNQYRSLERIHGSVKSLPDVMVPVMAPAMVSYGFDDIGNLFGIGKYRAPVADPPRGLAVKKEVHPRSPSQGAVLFLYRASNDRVPSSRQTAKKD